MKFSTAIELIKSGYFVADDAMKKMGTAIGLVDIEEMDDSVLVMKDGIGMETFHLDPSIVFDDREWYIAIKSEYDNFYDYYKLDDSKHLMDLDKFDEGMASGIREWYRSVDDCNCTESKDTKEEKEKRLVELQKEFLSKTTQLIYESDLTKKMKLYNELADLTAEINELENEVH